MVENSEAAPVEAAVDVQEPETDDNLKRPEKVTMRSLLEAGVHFGHQTKKWHPKMKPFVFTQRNGIHIIDIQQTLPLLETAAGFIESIAKSGKTVLFIGTKKQAQGPIEAEAQRSGMPYVTQRWLGGTLTNFETIRTRISFLLVQEDRRKKGEFTYLTKKESGKIESKIIKLNHQLGGIKEMEGLPGAIFVIDVEKEAIAVAEGRKLGIPVVAITDTDCNVDLVDYPIPGNDDAIRAIQLVTERISQAVIDGRNESAEEESDLALLASLEASKREKGDTVEPKS